MSPQLAAQLIIGAGTVKPTLNIYRKLEVANRTQTIVRAQEVTRKASDLRKVVERHVRRVFRMQIVANTSEFWPRRTYRALNRSFLSMVGYERGKKQDELRILFQTRYLAFTASMHVQKLMDELTMEYDRSDEKRLADSTPGHGVRQVMQRFGRHVHEPEYGRHFAYIVIPRCMHAVRKPYVSGRE